MTSVPHSGGKTRRRGEALEHALLDAAWAELQAAGYAGLTMEAVADRAGTSRAVLYRRWRNRGELVIAAMRRHRPLLSGEIPDTGSLRGDLLAVVRAMSGHLTSDFLAMMSGLVEAMRRDPALAGVLRAHLMDDAPAARLIIGRAVARGELRSGAEVELAALAHEVIEAQLFRQMAVGAPFDDTFAAHVVDDLLMPVLSRRPG